MTKTIKILTVTIKASKLYEESEKSLMFQIKTRGRFRRPLIFPKRSDCMFNFRKVIEWFPHWKGRTQEKAYKFDIPLWLYEKLKFDMEFLKDDIIIKNTHI